MIAVIRHRGLLILVLVIIVGLACSGTSETVEYYFNNAKLHVGNNEYQKAIEDLTEAIRIDPKFAKAYYNRAYIYSELGEYQKAIEDYTEVIRTASPLDPIYGLVYMSRGLAYDELGQKDKADVDRKRACELDSQFCG